MIGRSAYCAPGHDTLPPLVPMLTCLSIILSPSSPAVDDDCCEARDGKNGMLGEWSRDTAYLKKLAVDFQSAEPYPHVVIPNFFSEVRCTPVSSLLRGHAAANLPSPRSYTTCISRGPFGLLTFPSSAQEIASRIDRAFPIPSGKSASSWRAQGWHVYDNPIEGKLALDNIDLMKRHDSIFRCAFLHSPLPISRWRESSTARRCLPWCDDFHFVE